MPIPVPKVPLAHVLPVLAAMLYVVAALARFGLGGLSSRACSGTKVLLVNRHGHPRIEDFRFHDLRHTWASWHRQAGTSCDELKDLGGWKSRVMVDRYAKYAMEHLAVAANRLQRVRDDNVINLIPFTSRSNAKRAQPCG